MNETMNESRVDVARAWKDAAYREGLSEAERAALPENPAGLMELSDADLMTVEGGHHCGVEIGHTAFCLWCHH